MKDEPRKWEFVCSYFRDRDAPVGVPGGAPDASPPVDDRTWADLDMDAVFLKLDRTRSSVGQACLYDMLRRPLYDASALAERGRRIGLLAKDSRTRAKVGRILSRLGVQRDAEVFQFLTSIRGTVENGRRYLYAALSIAAAAVIPLVAVFGLPALALLALVTIVNIVIHYKFKAVVTVESPSYEYLFRLLGAAQRLSSVDVEAVREESAALRELSRSLAKIRRRCAVLMTPTGFSGDIAGLFLEYLRMYFLLEVTAYFFVHNEILHRMKDLSKLYGLVGGIDALVSVATIRREMPGHCVPEMDRNGSLLEAESVVHPLLSEPVPNSIRLDRRGVILTGSNMSGKSTFLRTLGVNQLLATTACIAFARRFRASPLFTMTSITNRDSILASESHYLVEAKRLLQILAAADGPRPALLIIDEILSGTNSEERIAASIRILRHLAAKSCLVIAATHDRPIAASLDDTYENVHFTHRVEGEGLEFDYQLREGIVEAGNAIRLLRVLGFPGEILEGLG